jgi:formylglycine-generating enzyme required for sulfatase activity
MILHSEGEQPRQAAIKQGFWSGKTEVTAGPWKQFVGATSHVTDAEKSGKAQVLDQLKLVSHEKEAASWRDPASGFASKDNHPVCCIRWNDAVAFCAWLNEREQGSGRLSLGCRVRLPTEAEWEYACRAGKQTKLQWGEKKEGGDNRLNRNGKGDGFEFVSPVDHCGAQGRSKFGLADMLGNVWECCLDEFDKKQVARSLSKAIPGVVCCGAGRSSQARATLVVPAAVTLSRPTRIAATAFGSRWVWSDEAGGEANG